MAKTQQFAGTQITSQPERLTLSGTLMYRDATRTKDQRFINCFQESIKNEISDSKKVLLVKRPGLTQSTQVLAGGGTARGFTHWNGKYYSVIDNNSGKIRKYLQEVVLLVGLLTGTVNIILLLITPYTKTEQLNKY